MGSGGSGTSCSSIGKGTSSSESSYSGPPTSSCAVGSCSGSLWVLLPASPSTDSAPARLWGRRKNCEALSRYLGSLPSIETLTQTPQTKLSHECFKILQTLSPGKDSRLVTKRLKPAQYKSFRLVYPWYGAKALDLCPRPGQYLSRHSGQ